MDRDGLKELELPMLYSGCIAAVTDGLGLWEGIDGSDGLRCVLLCSVGTGSSWGNVFALSACVKGPKSKLLLSAVICTVSGATESFGGRIFCSFGIVGTEGTSEVSQSYRDTPETVEVDLVRVYTELDPEGFRVWDFTVPELRGRVKSLLLPIDGLFLCGDPAWSSVDLPLTLNGPGAILFILFNMLPVSLHLV